MSKKSPRHSPDKPQNNYGGDGNCRYYDSSLGYTCCELGKEWHEFCDGNLHKCKSAKYKFLSSLSGKEKERILEKRGYQDD